MLALDPDTGKLRWHYQFTPHDTHDWDATETPVLVDLVWQGRPRKLLLQANRNAFFYVLDRVTGEFLSAKPYARQTWLKEFDKKGRPIALPNTEPSEEGTRLCPGLAGGANWMAPSYNPDLKMLFVPYREQCDIDFSTPPVFTEGKAYWGTTLRGVSDEKEKGMVKAIDPLTGEARWSFEFYRAGWGGTLSTSGGLLFAGDADGFLVALDSRTGKLLWKVQTGAEIATAPITYAVGGKQYVTIASGAALLTFTLP
jgi:alcohol dehydrogenase (cytochrome c)